MRGDANGRETDGEDGHPCRGGVWLLFGMEAKRHQLPVSNVGGPGVLAACVHVVCMLPRAGLGARRVPKQPGDVFLARARVDAGSAHRRGDTVRLPRGQGFRRHGACLCGRPHHWCCLGARTLLLGRDAGRGRCCHAHRDRGRGLAHQVALGACQHGCGWVRGSLAHHGSCARCPRRTCGARGAQRPSRDQAPHHAADELKPLQVAARGACGLRIHLWRHGG